MSAIKILNQKDKIELEGKIDKKVDSVTLESSVNNALAEAKSTGEFKGDKGDTGPQGIQGPIGLTGPEGPQGIQGEKGDTGAAGISVTKTEINQRGELVITLSDNTVSNLGIVVGAKGDKGDQGEQGVQGIQGVQGETGNGIASATINEHGELVIVYTNGDDINLGNVIGAKGETGATGATGAQGEQGLQGEKGDKGDKGDTGANGLTPYINAKGNWQIGDEDTGIAAQGEKGETGAAGTNGKDGADGYTPVKGTDYFTDEDKKEIVSDVISALDEIPDYWKMTLDTGVEAINTALTTVGYNKSAFLFYSDVHWNYGSKMSPKLLKYLYNHTGINKTVFGGDIVNDEATDYDTMSYLWEWRNMIKALPNHHSVVGNHDDGNTTNNLFDKKFIYGYLFAAEETSEIVRGSEMYYFIDNNSEKTRYLYLDTAYKGVDDKQQTFVKNALLTTPEGWHIVAISHIWYDNDYTTTPPTVGDVNSSASILLSMFDNYNLRIGDYENCGGWVEFCIGGHTHTDYDTVSSTGIPIILVETDSKHTRSGLTYTEGTDTESSVNGIIADYDNHKIYIVRIGRGESREVEVTNYIINYTNVLPLSIDTDGNVYNGVGYKANTRYSATSQAETSDASATGVYLSGYIPVSKENVIYIKNITMDKNIDDNGCRLLSLPPTRELGEKLEVSDVTAMNKYFNAVWDENSGILTQITINGDVSYIRL